MKKKVLILGSTGSIGTSTLSVIANDPALFDVHGLACATNIDLLNEQIDRFRPKAVCLFDGERTSRVNLQGARLYTGIEGIKEMIRGNADIVVNALPGSIGPFAIDVQIDGHHVIQFGTADAHRPA